GAEGWLVLRRRLGEQGKLRTYLSTAPASTPQAVLVRKSGMRWPVEAAIEECKGEVGMDHYEVRGGKGWHHHMTMTLLAHHFLVRQRCLLGKKSAALTVPQVRRLLQIVLANRQLDAETAIALIQYNQDQNYRAYCAHRKRRLRRLDSS